MAIQYEEASKTHLTESQARRVIADIYKAQSGRRLESHSAEDYFSRWASLRKGTVAATTLQEYESAAAEFIASLGDRANKDLAFITTTDVAQLGQQKAQDHPRPVSASVAGRTESGWRKILTLAAGPARTPRLYRPFCTTIKSPATKHRKRCARLGSTTIVPRSIR